MRLKPGVWWKNTGRKCLLIKGDVGQEKFGRKAVAQTVKEFDRLDIVVNNAAEQHPQDSIEKITEKQLEQTFRTQTAALSRTAEGDRCASAFGRITPFAEI